MRLKLNQPTKRQLARINRLAESLDREAAAVRAVIAERNRYRDALQRLYDFLPRSSCPAPAPDGCPVCQARTMLRDGIW